MFISLTLVGWLKYTTDASHHADDFRLPADTDCVSCWIIVVPWEIWPPVLIRLAKSHSLWIVLAGVCLASLKAPLHHPGFEAFRICLRWVLSVLSPLEEYVLYFSTSVWVLRNAGQNTHFQHFKQRKAKKARNLQQNFAKKNTFFKFAPKRWSTVLFQKNMLFTIW